MTERPKLSWLRVWTGLLGAPIAAAAMMVLPSGFYWPFKVSGLVTAIESWLVMCLYGVPLALVTALPLVLLFERLGWRGLFQYALGGAAIGVAISVVLPFFGSSYSPILSALMAVATGLSAVVFWAYAIFDWPSYVRRWRAPQ